MAGRQSDDERRECRPGSRSDIGRGGKVWGVSDTRSRTVQGRDAGRRNGETEVGTGRNEARASVECGIRSACAKIVHNSGSLARAVITCDGDIR